MKRKLMFLVMVFSLAVSHLQAISIQELIDQDYKRIKIRGPRFRRVLDLSNKNITSLEGLENIPGIETVHVLRLANNQIGTIPAGSFANAIKLRGLGLANSGIDTIEANAFAGLKNLRVLILNSNNLSSIPQAGLNGMPRLKLLAIGNNPLARTTRYSAELRKQVPTAFVVTLPITRQNLKRVGIGAASVVAVALAAVGTYLERTRRLKEVEKLMVPEGEESEESKTPEEDEDGGQPGAKPGHGKKESRLKRPRLTRETFEQPGGEKMEEQMLPEGSQTLPQALQAAVGEAQSILEQAQREARSKRGVSEQTAKKLEEARWGLLNKYNPLAFTKPTDEHLKALLKQASRLIEEQRYVAGYSEPAEQEKTSPITPEMELAREHELPMIDNRHIERSLKWLKEGVAPVTQKSIDLFKASIDSAGPDDVFKRRLGQTHEEVYNSLMEKWSDANQDNKELAGEVRTLLTQQYKNLMKMPPVRR